MTKTWCVGGKNFSDTLNQNISEKVNPESKNFIKIIKENFSCGGNKSQIFTK